jgi:hypothetical protein
MLVVQARNRTITTEMEGNGSISTFDILQAMGKLSECSSKVTNA